MRSVRVGDVVCVPCPESVCVEEGRDLRPDVVRVVDRRPGGLLTVEDDDGVRWTVGVEDVLLVCARAREGVRHGASA